MGNRFGVIAMYALAIIGWAFVIAGFATGDVGGFATVGCFAMLSSIWLQVCS